MCKITSCCDFGKNFDDRPLASDRARIEQLRSRCLQQCLLHRQQGLPGRDRFQ
ncbi:hypothetical protein H6F67_18745 [Microcoleus sp. FACHB-1515]|uniref:hypothetical protein n=1 Tax=Cyanophyceae TaxID=3028117 RepID=UPI0016827979|nr:hypothetical protein [Microcoleus sp. FACHB-1515]MBD2091886.1 hypothetical protein [Microcoleus sp. FACHB-1515]